MAKILLVEDDNNLREIYEARLQAEGYTIISAQDGEEALVKAKQEKPDLVISDVMMPRISGFEMLDILRNTEGLKSTKVIMLTALGQAEDKTRADSLGADRYLVKSQVTLEDIVKAAGELLAPDATTTSTEEAAQAPTAGIAAVAPAASATPILVPEPAVAMPPTVVPVPVVVAPPVVSNVPTPPQSAVVPEPANTPEPVAAAALPEPTVVAAPVAPTPAPQPSEPVTPVVESVAPEPAASEPVAAVEPVAATPEVPTTVEATTTEPEAPATQPAPSEDNDKLIADAVRNLTANLDKTPEEAPATEKVEPVATPVEQITAPEPAVEQASAVGPTASEPVETPETPASEPVAAVEPDIQPVTQPPVEPEAIEAPITPDSTAAATPQPETPDVITTAEPISPVAAPEVTELPASTATSTADEQALMQSQIDDFISQQNVAAPATVQPAPVTPQSVIPAPAETFKPETTPQPQQANTVVAPDQDDVSIAHKKIIQPPVEPITSQPNLSELLAKEGITSLDDVHSGEPSAQPTSPHQPGHVITPNGAPANAPNAFNSDDPNNIAL